MCAEKVDGNRPFFKVQMKGRGKRQVMKMATLGTRGIPMMHAEMTWVI